MQAPRGGTELQFEYLRKYVSKDLLDQVQITTSVPEKIPLHPTKLNILWQKIHMINQILHHGSKINLTIVSMIGMYLIHIGIMRNLE
jgi:hypothetical protein